MAISPTVNDLHVLFRVGEGEYALPAAEVLVMESYAGATRVPGVEPWVVGIVQIRGEVVPVVDLRRRFGLDGAELDGDRRVLVVRQGERSVGLLVDRAREVLSIGPDHLREPPEAVAQGTERMIRSVATVGDRLLMLIDTARVIGAVERRDAGEMGRGVDGD
jgi:purine-binding chemotaxis protein CheW